MEQKIPATDYVLSDDKAQLDVTVIHGFLAASYWSPGIPRSTVERAIAGSLCVGVYRGTEQVGFARVISDGATFAYLADVFVLPAHRGRSLSKALMEFIQAHPDLQGLRRFMLVTRDAQTLYRQFGFTSLANPDRVMEKTNPTVYQQTNASAL